MSFIQLHNTFYFLGVCSGSGDDMKLGGQALLLHLITQTTATGPWHQSGLTSRW